MDDSGALGLSPTKRGRVGDTDVLRLPVLALPSGIACRFGCGALPFRCGSSPCAGGAAGGPAVVEVVVDVAVVAVEVVVAVVVVAVVAVVAGLKSCWSASCAWSSARVDTLRMRTVPDGCAVSLPGSESESLPFQLLLTSCTDFSDS